MRRDASLDTLLVMDGERFWLEYGCYVKFEARLVEVTKHKPHGIDYSLTLHAKSGKRIFGMDNAHKAMDGRKNYKARVVEFDHLHPDGGKVSRPYKFETPEKLVSDFWRRVDLKVKELYE